ncbi:MAG: AEC family transporter [Clostridia bacterium]|nr:AEC family transporter [Clostridia bacterium]
MEIFVSTLTQMGFLFLLIVIGYAVSKLKVVPDNAPAVLSRLENNVFIPALVISTFMSGFTFETMTTAWQYLLGGLLVVGPGIPVAIAISRLCTRDKYIQKIYTYGLAFSNFGFMGNAVVKSMFPEVFPSYLIFVLFFWVFIYMWGVPVLLIPSEGGNKQSIKSRLRSFVNPMFIGMLIGMVLGLISPFFTVPGFIGNALTTLGDCMSPVAMLLTGMTIAKIDLKQTFINLNIYVVSLIRLIALPLIGILIVMLLPIPKAISVCVVCSLAMPLGLNTVVVPSAYGLDTKVAAGMALISHLLSCATIPLMFMIFEMLV